MKNDEYITQDDIVVMAEKLAEIYKHEATGKRVGSIQFNDTRAIKIAYRVILFNENAKKV